MKYIKSYEKKIIGKWEFKNGKTEKDSNCLRIEYLISNCLEKITESDDGWSVLYRNKDDGKYWELVYPESGYHGGGPPALILLTDEEVLKKYPSSNI